MEFNNQYLTYSEYVGLGGTLKETPFNILEFEARKIVDNYTFNRLKVLENQNQEVKLCIYNLITALNNQNTIMNQNKGISSENIDGYSVSYSSTDINSLKTNVEQNKLIVERYLSECKLENGTPYLYMGV